MAQPLLFRLFHTSGKSIDLVSDIVDFYQMIISFLMQKTKEKKRSGNAPSASLTHQQLPGADSRTDTEFSSGFLGFSSDLSCAQNRKTIT